MCKKNAIKFKPTQLNSIKLVPQVDIIIDIE